MGGEKHDEAGYAAAFLFSPVCLIRKNSWSNIIFERSILMKKLDALLSAYYHLFAWCVPFKSPERKTEYGPANKVGSIWLRCCLLSCFLLTATQSKRYEACSDVERVSTFRAPAFKSVPKTNREPSAAGSIQKGHSPAGERFGAQPPQSGDT